VLLVTTTHGDRCSVGGRSESESSQRRQDGDEHELRGKEKHVWEVKQSATGRRDQALGLMQGR
jgi:hypothetical protein